MQYIFLAEFLDIENLKELDNLELKAIEMLNDQPWMNCHFDWGHRAALPLRRWASTGCPTYHVEPEHHR